MFKKVGNCIVCGEKTQNFCDGCEGYICETHTYKPFANMEIILCKNCWENRKEILNKIKKRETVSDETNFSGVFSDYP